MRLFRVTTQRERAAALDGLGASLYPGRWNERGRRTVYTTSRLPLGILEVLVQSSLTALTGFVAYPLDVPDDALTALDRTILPVDWRTMPGRDACRACGEEWRSAGISLGLVVPSAVVPEAHDLGDVNVVLDPLHRDFSRIAVGKPIALAPDSRLQSLVAPRSRRQRR